MVIMLGGKKKAQSPWPLCMWYTEFNFKPLVKNQFPTKRTACPISRALNIGNDVVKIMWPRPI